MDSRTSTMDVICASFNSLSEAEQRVANYVIQNSEEVVKLSLREIASKSGVSSATTSRFVRHIGFESFSDLRLALAADQAVRAPEHPNTTTEISLSNISASVDYILSNKIQELQGTAAQLDESAVERTVDLISASDNILFAAVGNSIPVCSNLAFKLGQIGLRAVCPSTTEAMVLFSLSLKRSDLLFVVSASGYSHRLETIIDNAEDSGTPIIFVTSNPTSTLAQRSDVVLSAVTRDRILTGTQFSTHVAEDFIVETIFMFLLAEGKVSYEHARLEQKILGRDKETAPTLN